MQAKAQHPDDASLKNRLTLVVLTHNRPDFLRRTLFYYRNYSASILVLDSSLKADEQIAFDYPEVDYRHLPQFSYTALQDKLTYGVNEVVTPFMTFLAVDDFLLHEGMTRSLQFLEQHPDYGVCHGYGMMYLARGTQVDYYKRDNIVQEDYCAEDPEQRLLEFMGQFLPPFYAVTRTDLLQQWYALLPAGTNFEWQEIGHSFYLLANAKARILPIPYAVREVNYNGSEHGTNVLTVLALQDEQSRQGREDFAEFLASIPTALSAKGAAAVKQIALESFRQMAEGLLSGRSLEACPIIRSQWQRPNDEPQRIFGERQFVELPFYNKPMFDLMTEFEFLIHTMPAGRQQLIELEPILRGQWQLLQDHAGDDEGAVRDRLWDALVISPFNQTVVRRLLAVLELDDEKKAEAAQLHGWLQRLQSVPCFDSQALLASMPSGRLLNWLKAREPSAELAQRAAKRLEQGGPSFGILLLDLQADTAKLQATLDSLMHGYSRAFKVVVFTSGEPPAATKAYQTVHFVKVTQQDHVQRMNEAARQLGTDWIMLAESGDLFTAGGLLRAGLELLGVEGVRAVAMDELQVEADGALVDVLRPGVNLDLLQSLPSQMARHWLVRRDLWIGVGAFDARYPLALEFDLLLRLIAQDGLAGLAHLAEPLLICAVPDNSSHDQERAVLAHHLTQRGYAASVGSAQPGTLLIEYRHAERPLVSIILQCQDNFARLQAYLVSVLQRTRYQNHEILIADNASKSPELLDWLHSLEAAGSRLRVVRSDVALSPVAMLNLASQQARGEYLVLLGSEVEVLNANWLEALLNQAQRPEVGVVGGKMLSPEGLVAEAGLVLAGRAGVRAAFAGEAKDAPGYMQRLQLAHGVSAVSGFIMVRAQLLRAVGGLDEQMPSVRAAQVEVCLQAAAAGLLVVCTPQAQAVQHAQLEDDALACPQMRERWQHVLAQDTCYNVNHSIDRELFSIDQAGQVDWQALIG
ncbi:TIGR00180 family glycosyltransferase [Pseudomonas monteilii]|uniref:TIGR00180 family glycosyltransferase n=1 Tax=Pseudomonas TaxID=286 RepID=UPI00048C29B1|nr:MULTISPECIES: TIGR00180 family glycosyltransferase [Pseudomonas]MBA1314355.1 TIGR00180 family glycosyltransferase [Pseudomonas monteilii]MCE1019866.1 TIGR00180 family glycosyltransferase [Pseudomonas monteilii]MCE1037197.1 TIGR00180 family glycosyltransferase [Pseudomonas monteilii]MCE1088993.1 TIGR00180 family glycosyltransferase [Pseudomonas monteilii]MDH0020020.1 TIGR00180 family glycosyltransferase [Pseudomonas monteilii]